ncbi:MAG: glycosyltransferase family 39 protein [Verrucomicrobiota bacterium]
MHKRIWNFGDIHRFCRIVFFLSLLVFLGLAYSGLDHTLLGHHSYRKTQTALNTESILRTGDVLGYETPVTGPPWRVTFEFPLYQSLTAVFSKVFPTEVVISGRMVSLLSFLIAVFTLYHLIRMITGPECPAAIITASLLVTAPVYRYWSTTFMIETTALAMSLLWLYSAIWAVRYRSWAVCLLAMLLGSLAGLGKVTTFLVFIPLYLLLLAWQYDSPAKLRSWLTGQDKTGQIRKWLGTQELWILSYMLVIPLVLSYSWVKVADTLKGDNPLSVEHTSRALRDWNFGSLEQKLNLETWGRMVDQIHLTVFHPVLIFAFLLVAFLMSRLRYRILLVIGAVCYGVPLVVFTNLYYVHDYYFCANSVFLLTALGCGAAGIYQNRARALGVTYIALLIVCLNYQYLKGYHYLESTNHDYILPLAQFIQQRVPQEGIIVIYGYPGGRNPELTYYSQRKSIMFIDQATPESPKFRQVFGMLDESDIRAVIFCSSYYDRDDMIHPVVSYFGMSPTPAYQQNLAEEGMDWDAREHKWKVFLRQ